MYQLNKSCSFSWQLHNTDTKNYQVILYVYNKKSHCIKKCKMYLTVLLKMHMNITTIPTTMRKIKFLS